MYWLAPIIIGALCLLKLSKEKEGLLPWNQKSDMLSLFHYEIKHPKIWKGVFISHSLRVNAEEMLKCWKKCDDIYTDCRTKLKQNIEYDNCFNYQDFQVQKLILMKKKIIIKNRYTINLPFKLYRDLLGDN